MRGGGRPGSRPGKRWRLAGATRQPALASLVALTPLAALALVAGCGEQAPTDEAASGPERWQVDPTPVLSVGELEGEDPYLLSGVAGAALLDDGGIVVGDRASGTLRVFDARGRFIREMGGVGEGPGEFGYLSFLALNGDTLTVYDSSLTRLTRFTLDGRLVSTTPFQGLSAPDQYVARLDHGGHVGLWLTPVPIQGGSLQVDEANLGRFTPDGELVSTLMTLPGMRRLGSPLPLSPHVLAGILGDTLFVTDGVGSALRAVTLDGDSSFVVETTVPAPDAAEALARLRDALPEGWAERLAEVEDRPEMDTVPTFSDLLVRDGRLWLKRYDAASDSHWLGRRRTGGEWVGVASDGTAEALLRVPDDLRLLDVRGDRIVGVARDSLDVERVQVHRVSGT